MTPYIQALIAMTSDNLQQRMQKDPTSASDSLLFMGNQHDTVPRRLLQDPLLSPRDKFAWQVIGCRRRTTAARCSPPTANCRCSSLTAHWTKKPRAVPSGRAQ
ncbi:hypothetical protein VQZ99_000356 [Salmonella enterica]|nr:hypothetical protein [Salmonella enterica]EJX5631343.1 hypothetical protein [Salmonella enterica]EMD2996984.1 hypothetical protein [Salmonella enterica]EMD3101164.1 hypothetical protein [Salmonella enterica]EMD3305897.1 hypothetical protein [Salmonella enterica]